MAYKSNSNKFWTGFLAVLLVLVIAGTAALVGVLSDGFKNWDKFKTNEEQTEETADNGGAIIGESVGSGVKVMSAKITSEDYAANGISPMAETAYQLTATITPDTAVDKTVDWSVAFVNPASAWATGKTVTDYVTVTPTSDGALTANVECLEAFGETVIITVTSRDNPEVSATCRVDYAKKLTGVSLTLGRNPYTNFLKPETTTKELSGLVIDLNANVNAPSGYATTVTVGGSSSVYTLDDDWTFTATMHEATAPLNGTINGKAHRSVMGFGEGEDILGTAIDFDYDWLNAHSFHISETSVAGSGSAGYYLYNTAGQTMLSYCNALTDGYLCAITVTATGEYSSFEWTINVKCTWKYTTSVTGASLSEDQIVF